jgi:hypothetical protein
MPQTRQKIQSVIDTLERQGIIYRGAGYCISMSDIVMNMLKHQGIDSYMKEVKLTVFNEEPFGVMMLGHDDNTTENKPKLVDTHVVTITATDPPYLLDLSIRNVRPDIVPYIFEPINEHVAGDRAELLTVKIKDSTWLYQDKGTNKLPRLHNQSMIRRFELDHSIQRQLKWMRGMMIALMLLVLANFGRGLYDFSIQMDNNERPEQEALSR